MWLIKESVHVYSDEINKHAKMRDKLPKCFSFCKGNCV